MLSQTAPTQCPVSLSRLTPEARLSDSYGMSDHTDNLPVFLTRHDVANLLRITPRQVDRIAKAGVLSKQKLSASRSGFERSGVEAYLQQMNGGKPAPSTAPVQDGVIEVKLGAVTGHKGGEYGSRIMLLHVQAEGDVGEVAAALEWWACDQGFPGMIFNAGGGAISIMWAKTLGYDPAQVRKALELVKAAIIHAAE
jgi:hypothetical protein